MSSLVTAVKALTLWYLLDTLITKKVFVSAYVRIFKACSGAEVLIRSFSGCDSNLTQLTTTFNDEYRFPKSIRKYLRGM